MYPPAESTLYARMRSIPLGSSGEGVGGAPVKSFHSMFLSCSVGRLPRVTHQTHRTITNIPEHTAASHGAVLLSVIAKKRGRRRGLWRRRRGRLWRRRGGRRRRRPTTATARGAAGRGAPCRGQRHRIRRPGAGACCAVYSLRPHFGGARKGAGQSTIHTVKRDAPGTAG